MVQFLVGRMREWVGGRGFHRFRHFFGRSDFHRP
jgi:hypothetical protein